MGSTGWGLALSRPARAGRPDFGISSYVHPVLSRPAWNNFPASLFSFLTRGYGMAATKDYQRYAARCLETARETSDRKLKAFLIEMAQEWQRLAQQAKGIKAGWTDTANAEPDRGD
jgi:hypothetical protein